MANHGNNHMAFDDDKESHRDGYPSDPNQYRKIDKPDTGQTSFEQQEPASGYAYYQPATRKQDRLKPNGKHYFSARTIMIPLLFYFIHIGLQTAGTIIVIVLTMLRDGLGSGSLQLDNLEAQMMEQQSYIFLISGTLSILVYAIALTVMNRRHDNYLLTKKPTLSEATAGGLLAIGAIGATTLILVLIQLLAGVSSFWSSSLDYYIELTEAFGDSAGIVAQILAFAVVVPIAEELLFRGIVCGELMRVFPDWAVILISGVFFAVIHMNVIQSSYVLLAGIVLSAVYVWSGSIYLPILMHMVYNFLGSSLGLLIGNNEELAVWVTNIELLFVPIGIFIAIWFYRKKKYANLVEA